MAVIIAATLARLVAAALGVWVTVLAVAFLSAIAVLSSVATIIAVGVARSGLDEFAMGELAASIVSGGFSEVAAQAEPIRAKAAIRDKLNLSGLFAEVA